MTEQDARKRALGVMASMGLAFGCAVASHAAYAESLTLLKGSTLVQGRQSDVYSFNVSGAGTLDIQLKDLQWPERLANLTWAVTSGNSVLASWNVGGKMTVDIAQGGSYYAYVFAQAGPAYGLNLGMYSYRAEFTPGVAAPVPLPSAIRLVLSGLTLVGIARHVWKEGPRPDRLTARRNESVMCGA